MTNHTIMMSICSADGFTREISLPGAGDLPHLAEVFRLALALLPGNSGGAPLASFSEPDVHAPENSSENPRKRLASFCASARKLPRRTH